MPNIIERKPIWIALSDFYLDTELQDYDFNFIALAIIKSPYTFKEVQQINKYEVFPLLQVNLFSVAGVWAGFNEEWLVKNITLKLENSNFLKKIILEFSYFRHKWMCKNYWIQLEQIYIKLKKMN